MSGLHDAADLKSYLRYDPSTGIFTWIKHLSIRTQTEGLGEKEIARTPGVRTVIGFRGRKYLAHRLAWLYVHGKWPVGLLDHVNGDPSDNRIDNLREASAQQNQANSRRSRNNLSGFKGVSKQTRNNTWRARITVGSEEIHLGTFPTREVAHKAYQDAALRHFGDFARFK